MDVLNYTDGTRSVDVTFDSSKYINATESAKGWNKRPETWLKTQNTKNYISALESVLTDTKLVTVQNGGVLPGTWLHPKLAIAFARWLDPKFAVWCDQKIDELLQTGATTATVSERNVWKSRFPELFKNLKKPKKQWGPKFMEAAFVLEDEGASVKSQKEFLYSVTDRFTGDSKIAVYKRIGMYYDSLFQIGKIERRTWEDMSKHILQRVSQVNAGRGTRATNALKKLKKEHESLKKDHNASSTKASPYYGNPIKLDNILSTGEDIDVYKDTVKASAHSELWHSGFLKTGGGISSKGKPLPDYEASTIKSLSNIGIWENDNKTFFLRIEKFTSRIEMRLSYIHIPGGGTVCKGYTTSGMYRYVGLFNPGSCACVVYRYKLPNSHSK